MSSSLAAWLMEWYWWLSIGLAMGFLLLSVRSYVATSKKIDECIDRQREALNHRATQNGTRKR